MRNRLLPFQGPRLIFFAVAMLGAFAVLIARLYEFQFINYNTFLAAANENAVQKSLVRAARGVVYDRNGVALALNAAAFTIQVVPAELPDDVNATLQVLNQLAALIDVPATRAAADAAGKFTIRSLEELIDEGQRIAPYRAVVVAADVRPEVAYIILENIRQLPGVKVEAVSVRQYPTGTFTAQLIGYLGPIGTEEAEELREQGLNPQFERTGYAGIEAYLNDDLAGVRGELTQVVDVAGLPLRVLERREPQPGKNIRLTIDYELQKVATEILNFQINAINQQARDVVSQSGVVIAMNPQTGEILAMVSLPTYDNSRFARGIDVEYYLRIAGEAFTPLQNHAIQSKYPPGSVWKLISASAVLNEDVIRPESQLFDGGILTIQNRFAANDVVSEQDFVCWLKSGHSQVDLIRGIAWSCDVYFYQVGGGNPEVSPQTLKPGGLGITALVKYSTAYNIGVDTGIELPAEISARVPDPTWKRRNIGESWSTGDTYNATFGQGYIDVTPLQLLASSAAIANGGTYYQPTIIRTFVDSQGNDLTSFSPKVARTLALPPDGRPVYLNMREDMYIMGKDSLACTCEPRGDYNNPGRDTYIPGHLDKCTEDFKQNYRGRLRLTPQVPSGVTAQGATDRPIGATQGVTDIEYRVNVPYGYQFDGAPGRMCDVLRIQENGPTSAPYQPPFIRPEYFQLVEEGMYEATTILGGTARAAQLGFVPVGGKTGTAEYCDEIARPKGLCVPGQWPAHAWYFGYAPYQVGDPSKPEIAIIAFLYNGREGSGNALPVVKRTMYCYFQFKSQRASPTFNGRLSPCDWDKISVRSDTPGN